MIDIFQVLIDTFDLPDVCFKIQSSPFFQEINLHWYYKRLNFKSVINLNARSKKKNQGAVVSKNIKWAFLRRRRLLQQVRCFRTPKNYGIFSDLKLMTFICQRIFLKRVYKICQIASNLVLKLM